MIIIVHNMDMKPEYGIIPQIETDETKQFGCLSALQSYKDDEEQGIELDGDHYVIIVASSSQMEIISLLRPYFRDVQVAIGLDFAKQDQEFLKASKQFNMMSKAHFEQIIASLRQREQEVKELGGDIEEEDEFNGPGGPINVDKLSAEEADELIAEMQQEI